jgi:hypothetical protein
MLGLPQNPASLPVAANEIPIREELSHEISVKWNGDRGRLDYRCTCLGANKRRPHDPVAQRAISDISADGIDGLAYAEPLGEGAASCNATREGSRRLQRQHCQSTQRPGSWKKHRRRNGRGAGASNGRCARARWPKKRLWSAEPNLWHAWGGATICQRANTGQPLTEKSYSRISSH